MNPPKPATDYFKKSLRPIPFIFKPPPILFNLMDTNNLPLTFFPHQGNIFNQINRFPLLLDSMKKPLGKHHNILWTSRALKKCGFYPTSFTSKPQPILADSFLISKPFGV
jgi:hypothetical protein